MKTITISLLLLAFAGSSSAAPPEKCTMSMAEARTKIPELAGLNDHQAIDVIREVYYPNLDRAAVARALCMEPPPAPTPRELNALDRWRFDSCQRDAAMAPTAHGVNVAMRLCRERFAQ